MADSEPVTPLAGMAGGAILIVLGIGAYVITDFASLTALIPTFIGIPMLALGVLGFQFDRPRIATYAIGALGGLGALGSARVLPELQALVTGGDVDSVVATVSQGIVILTGLVLVAAVGYDHPVEE